MGSNIIKQYIYPVSHVNVFPSFICIYRYNIKYYNNYNKIYTIYAVNTQLYININLETFNETLTDITNNITTELKYLYSYNYLKFNRSKTKFIIFYDKN